MRHVRAGASLVQSTGRCTRAQVEGRAPARSPSTGPRSDGRGRSSPAPTASPSAGLSTAPTGSARSCSNRPSCTPPNGDCRPTARPAGSTGATTPMPPGRDSMTSGSTTSSSPGDTRRLHHAGQEAPHGVAPAGRAHQLVALELRSPGAHHRWQDQALNRPGSRRAQRPRTEVLSVLLRGSTGYAGHLADLGAADGVLQLRTRSEPSRRLADGTRLPCHVARRRFDRACSGSVQDRKLRRGARSRKEGAPWLADPGAQRSGAGLRDGRARARSGWERDRAGPLRHVAEKLCFGAHRDGPRRATGMGDPGRGHARDADLSQGRRRRDGCHPSRSCVRRRRGPSSRSAGRPIRRRPPAEGRRPWVSGAGAPAACPRPSSPATAPTPRSTSGRAGRPCLGCAGPARAGAGPVTVTVRLTWPNEAP